MTYRYSAPWTQWVDKDGTNYIKCGETVVVRDLSLANATRIIACVNACAYIADVNMAFRIVDKETYDILSENYDEYHNPLDSAQTIRAFLGMP